MIHLRNNKDYKSYIKQLYKSKIMDTLNFNEKLKSKFFYKDHSISQLVNYKDHLTIKTTYCQS